MGYIFGHLPNYVWVIALIGSFFAFGNECRSLKGDDYDDRIR